MILSENEQKSQLFDLVLNLSVYVDNRLLIIIFGIKDTSFSSGTVYDNLWYSIWYNLHEIQVCSESRKHIQPISLYCIKYYILYILPHPQAMISSLKILSCWRLTPWMNPRHSFLLFEVLKTKIMFLALLFTTFCL